MRLRIQLPIGLPRPGRQRTGAASYWLRARGRCARSWRRRRRAGPPIWPGSRPPFSPIRPRTASRSTSMSLIRQRVSSSLIFILLGYKGSMKTMGKRGMEARETWEGWPLLAVETAVKWKGSFLGWFVRLVVPVKEIFPALAALVGPVQNIFSLTVHNFNSSFPIARQAGQTVVLGHLSLNTVCAIVGWTFMGPQR